MIEMQHSKGEVPSRREFAEKMEQADRIGAARYGHAHARAGLEHPVTLHGFDYARKHASILAALAGAPAAQPPDITKYRKGVGLTVSGKRRTQRTALRTNKKRCPSALTSYFAIQGDSSGKFPFTPGSENSRLGSPWVNSPSVFTSTDNSVSLPIM